MYHKASADHDAHNDTRSAPLSAAFTNTIALPLVMTAGTTLQFSVPAGTIIGLYVSMAAGTSFSHAFSVGVGSGALLRVTCDNAGLIVIYAATSGGASSPVGNMTVDSGICSTVTLIMTA
jgi:hypothetical protein